MQRDDDERVRPLPEDMRRRLTEALAHRDMSVRDLSRVVLIGESTLGAIFNGKQDVKASNLFKIIDALGANPGWVIANMLPRYVDGDSSESGLVRAVPNDADRWIRTQPEGSVTPAEAEYLRSAPLPQGSEGERNAAYSTLLQALRYATTLFRTPR